MTWDGVPSGCPGPSLAEELWTFVPAPGHGLLVPTKTLIPVSPSLDLARLTVPVQGHQGHWGRASSRPGAGVGGGRERRLVLALGGILTIATVARGGGAP